MSKDAETFGFDAPPSNVPWDQFETNSRLFGATTDYKEELYTTKLDKGGSNFKQREKEATRLANEIMGVSGLLSPSGCADGQQAATNSHVAEERNQAAEGAAKDEEAK